MISDAAAFVLPEVGSPEEALRCSDLADLQERAGRNNKLITAVHWAHQHPAESIDPHQLRIAGGDRPIRPGGDGTPEMAGFAVAEFGVHKGWSIGRTQRFIGDALDIRHRLPRLWARLVGYKIDGWQAQKIAQETHHLTLAQALLADEAVADYVGRSDWSQVLRLLEAKIIEVDADRISKLAEEFQTEQGVWVGQSVEHGTKTLFWRGGAPDVIWFEAMVDRIADVLAGRGDTRTKNLRRAAAVGILANPLHALRLLAEDDAPSLFDPDLEGVEDLSGVDLGPAGETEGPGMQPEGPELVEGPGRQAEVDHPVRFPRIDQDRVLARAMVAAIGRLDPARMRPDATLYVHIARETLESGLGVARVEDIGPVVSSLVADWLGRCDVTVKPVIDLNVDLTPVDAYEVPRAMRERMFLKRLTSVFPFSSSRGQGLDLDHSDPYRDGVPGQTREDNLAPLGRREHNLITHGLWNRRQPEPGTFLFRAPHGKVFLVNSTGTHDLGEGPFAHQIWHAATPERSN
ncbi:hypothetical protein FOE78_18955 [Microlunatus elymi]|uniref:DUF222 domain-containing protein n=1 Tax=Microlunatus elymi TaxID=2596828 RepID=A0A516Q2U9_9ACTN|nr:HNH endonuclease signature motif containing protein [Microlunatus elymi]QDP97712.1 hypothetical protein FOE78_18955 [Microlunatus elymi]